MALQKFKVCIKVLFCYYCISCSFAKYTVDNHLNYTLFKMFTLSRFTKYSAIRTLNIHSLTLVCQSHSKRSLVPWTTSIYKVPLISYLKRTFVMFNVCVNLNAFCVSSLIFFSQLDLKHSLCRKQHQEIKGNSDRQQKQRW